MNDLGGVIGGGGQFDGVVGVVLCQVFAVTIRGKKDRNGLA